MKNKNKFIVGRKKLSNYMSEKDVTRVMVRAGRLKGVEMTERMTTNKADYIISAPHFNIKDWLNAQKEHLKVMRSDAVELNEKLYKKMSKILKDIEGEKK